MRVEVYRNLHKQCLSVKALKGENKGRVIDRPKECIIRDAKFVVQPAGREKVIREQRKNVHAFVRGERVDSAKCGKSKGPELISYNPYKAGYFRREDGSRVDGADLVVIRALEGRKSEMLAHGTYSD